MAKGPKKLDELFHDTLKDIYFAEKKILSTLPKMAKAARSEELKAAFEKHRGETEGQMPQEQLPSDLQSAPFISKPFYLAEIERVLQAVAGWLRTLRRRSQKDHFSWQRMHRPAADWIPKPRILHPYPDKRFAFTHPRLEPCAGIPPARIWAGGGQ
jgi:hypothetical protein